mmetsp:Transcript_4687/g.20002  ORF Transcript_4687/g.20002 Transcript_4687/m.20002 type:complete len:271 (+) Transcript_4687:165-977(+)
MRRPARLRHQHDCRTAPARPPCGRGRPLNQRPGTLLRAATEHQGRRRVGHVQPHHQLARGHVSHRPNGHPARPASGGPRRQSRLALHWLVGGDVVEQSEGVARERRHLRAAGRTPACSGGCRRCFRSVRHAGGVEGWVQRHGRAAPHAVRHVIGAGIRAGRPRKAVGHDQRQRGVTPLRFVDRSPERAQQTHSARGEVRHRSRKRPRRRRRTGRAALDRKGPACAPHCGGGVLTGAEKRRNAGRATGCLGADGADALPVLGKPLDRGPGR